MEASPQTKAVRHESLQKVTICLRGSSRQYRIDTHLEVPRGSTECGVRTTPGMSKQSSIASAQFVSR